ncbi:hypothetical protein KJZ61_00185 [Candidatus Dependentiae bacterium]|nr:hypothetical protein [Candidatus Dependentiae bacterium]
MNLQLASMYAMEPEANQTTVIGYQQPKTTLSDIVSLEAGDQSSASRNSLSSTSFPSRPPSEQISIDIEDFGHDIQQETQVTVAKILQCTNVQIPQSCQGQSCQRLIQQEIDSSKLNNPTQYQALLAAISNQHRGVSDAQSQQAATLFLLDVLGRGIETYKSDLRENQERSEGQRKTISRQKAVITGSVITAVAGGAATIISAAITAYFAAHNKC